MRDKTRTVGEYHLVPLGTRDRRDTLDLSLLSIPIKPTSRTGIRSSLRTLV